jgi:hypothetical protein
MLRAAALVLSGVLIFAQGASAEFVGELNLLPSGCEATGKCKLGSAFSYKDPFGVGWEAKKDLVTDGASIPPWAQHFVGEPFDKAFIRAAVIHDHYCDRHVRPWRQTHRVFYDALLESGVSRNKAGIMYFAVMIGGPKWVKIIKGGACSNLGASCINNYNDKSQVPGADLMISGQQETFLKKENQFGSARFARLMNNNVPYLESQGETLTPKEVEDIANQVMADDFYYKNKDEIGGDLQLEIKQQVQ